MKTSSTILKNEAGSTIVIVLLFSAMLTIIGISAVQNTVAELWIVRNNLVHRDHVYRAEAAALEGARWVENTGSSVLTDHAATVFLSKNGFDLSNLDLNDGRWQMSGVDPDQNGATMITGYSIVDQTGPVDLAEKSNLYTYTVYGLYDRPGGINKGRVLIEIGYRKRF